MYNNNFKNKKFHPIKILGIAGMVVLFLGIAGGVVMFLWNAIIPEVTGWKPLTYWQSIGLLVLFKILFGNNVLNIQHGIHANGILCFNA